jgi:hypothetical protein
MLPYQPMVIDNRQPVAQFIDGSPLTDGMANLAASFLNAGPAAAQIRDRRAQQDMANLWRQQQADRQSEQDRMAALWHDQARGRQSDQDRIALLWHNEEAQRRADQDARGEFDRDIAQALASGIGSEYNAPEAVPGGVGPVAPVDPQVGVLRNLFKYQGTGQNQLINAAATRGREDRDLTVRGKEAQIAAMLGRTDKAAEQKSPITFDQALRHAERNALASMGYGGTEDLGSSLETTIDQVTGAPVSRRVAISPNERAKRASAYQYALGVELERLGYSRAGEPVSPTPAPDGSGPFGFDMNKLDYLRATQGADPAQSGGDAAPSIDLAQARPAAAEDLPQLPEADVGAWVGALRQRDPATTAKLRRWLTGVDESGKRYPPAQAANLRKHAETIIDANRAAAAQR